MNRLGFDAQGQTSSVAFCKSAGKGKAKAGTRAVSGRGSAFSLIEDSGVVNVRNRWPCIPDTEAVVEKF